MITFDYEIEKDGGDDVYVMKSLEDTQYKQGTLSSFSDMPWDSLRGLLC